MRVLAIQGDHGCHRLGFVNNDLVVPLFGQFCLGVANWAENAFSYGERPFCLIYGGQRNPMSGEAAAVAAKAFTSFPPVRWLLSKLQRVRAREVAQKNLY